MLSAYQQQTLRLLHDPNNTYFSSADITAYINIARNQVAGEGQCVRLLLSGGTITAITILSGGSGYAGTATVTISGSGQMATATATISGGAVNSITMTNGGWGYITGTTTTVTVAGSTSGTNATFTVTIDNSVTTVPGQEVYLFSTINTLAVLGGSYSATGINQVIGVLSVACAWGANAAMKPVLQPAIWTELQAYYRSYNNGMQNYPTIWSQYGQGVNGSIYVWPLPSQYSQMDWDCYCFPVALIDDTTPEAIPFPWTDCVPYYAAYLAYANAQRAEDSDRMFNDYERFMKRSRSMSETPFVPDYYSSDI